MISTLMDMRLPSGAVVNPAETCAGEQPWYSRSVSGARALLIRRCRCVPIDEQGNLSLSIPAKGSKPRPAPTNFWRRPIVLTIATW